MKRTFQLSLIYLLWFVTNGEFSYSQNNRITLGIKGGISNSTVDGRLPDGSPTGYMSYELYGGVFLEKRLNRQFNLGSELLLAVTSPHTFVELPVHLKYTDLGRFNFLLGPKLDYAVNHTDEFNKVKKWGISGEIGTQFKLSSRYFAEARYSKGFTRMIITDYGDLMNGRRNIFRLGVGYNFSPVNFSKDFGTGPMRIRYAATTGHSLSKNYGLVLGADISIQKELSKQLTAVLSGGYNNYALTSGFIEDYVNYFPFKGGLKIFPSGRLYVMPEVGMAVGMHSQLLTYPFIYAGGIGIQTKSDLDLSLRYEKMTGRYDSYLNDISRPDMLALRIGYGFNLRPVKTPGIKKMPESEIITGKHRKTVFIEALGQGLGISANFDVRLKADRNDGFGLRTGLGLTRTWITMPLMVNHILGDGRHGLETGGGITAFLNTDNTDSRSYDWYNRTRVGVTGVLHVGYRLQSRNGFTLRVTESVIFNQHDFLPIYPGLSIGYNFK